MERELRALDPGDYVPRYHERPEMPHLQGNEFGFYALLTSSMIGLPLLALFASWVGVEVFWD